MYNIIVFESITVLSIPFQFGIHNPQEHLRFQNIVAKYPLHHAGAGG